MHPPRTRLAVAVHCVCVLAAGGARGLPAPTEHWLGARTAHFSIVGNAPEPVLRSVGLEIERFVAVLENESLGAMRKPGIPTTLLVFRNEFSLRPYVLQPDGMPKSLSGEFVPSAYGDFIVMNGDLGYATKRIVLHEYVHQVLQVRGPDLPLCVNEGMAEYYSTFAAQGDVGEIGRPVVEHVGRLRSTELMPLERLFAIDRRSSDYNESTRQGLFYAESWAFLHYILAERADLYPRLESFLLTPQRQTNWPDAFTTAFRMPPEAMDSALATYIHQPGLSSRRVDLRGLPAPPDLNFQPVTYSQALCTLGEFLMRGSPWQASEAEAHLRAALVAYPGNARALALLGSLRLASRANAEAESLFAAARTSGKNDATVWFDEGMSRVEQYFEDYPEYPLRPDSLPASLREARKSLQRSLVLNPARAEAHAGLGATYLLDPGDPAAGIAALERALQALPGRSDVAQNLSVLQLRSGDPVRARAVVDAIDAEAKPRKSH